MPRSLWRRLNSTANRMLAVFERPYAAQALIGRTLEIRIVEIDVGNLMAGRRQIDEPRAGLHQRCDPVDQHEMAEMVGSELRLEPVRSLAEWRRHDAGVANHEIERPAVGDKRVGASPHARQRRKIELDQLKGAAVRGVGAHRRGRPFGLGQIARRAHHFGAMRRERAGRLNPEARRRAGHQHAPAAQTDAFQHVVGCGFGSKGLRHDLSPGSVNEGGPLRRGGGGLPGA